MAENSGIRVELACCESTLLAEITDLAFTRADVAKTYWLALRSSERGAVDWAKVNRAIIARWSPAALQWIKTRVWKAEFPEVRA